MLKKKKIYDIVLFVKKITERCPSGLRSWSWKPVMLNGTVGSNPTLSAKTNAQIAQSVEQGTENPRVGGSIPPLGTRKCGGIA